MSTTEDALQTTEVVFTTDHYSEHAGGTYKLGSKHAVPVGFAASLQRGGVAVPADSEQGKAAIEAGKAATKAANKESGKSTGSGTGTKAAGK